MELNKITPVPEPAYYTGMLAPGIRVEIKPDPPSMYWDWTLFQASRSLAACGIFCIKGRSVSLKEAHDDALQAAKMFPARKGL
jgi:hypothetical protein